MIRPAALADLKAMLHMGRRFFDASSYGDVSSYDPESTCRAFLKLMESDSACLLVAEQDGEIIGFCSAIAYPHFFNESDVNAQELFWWVDEQHRKSGAGKAMLQALEAWAASVGAKSLMMLSLASLAPEKVAQMYLVAGYRPAEQTFIKGL